MLRVMLNKIKFSIKQVLALNKVLKINYYFKYEIINPLKSYKAVFEKVTPHCKNIFFFSENIFLTVFLFFQK